MNLTAIHTLLQIHPNMVVYRVQVGTVGWPHSWSDEVWCFTARSYAPCGQGRCPVEKKRIRQTGREWLAEAADEARALNNSGSSPLYFD